MTLHHRGRGRSGSPAPRRQVLVKGGHRLLCNEHGNVLQVGRTAATNLIRTLRDEGLHPYPLCFSPTDYNVGLADSKGEAQTLQERYDRERAAIRRTLIHQSTS